MMIFQWRGLVFCAVVLCAFSGCGGGGGGDGGGSTPAAPDYSVTISPTSASVAEGDARQFSATVANPTNNGVTWGLYGSGCAGATCGTVSSSGLYTAPSTTPNPATVNLTATSRDDSSKVASAVVTVVPGIKVSVSPTSANVGLGQTQQFNALVQNTTNTAVNWSVAGGGCSGATCGTIGTGGLYTAPSTAPNPATVTVTATSQADSRKSGSATVTIGASSLDRLSGSYAFILSGFDPNGPMQVAGSFFADGHGNLTNGIEDVNRATGVSTQVSFTGTYSLGADSRGQMTLKSALGTSSFRFALSADGSAAQLIEFDGTGTRCSGLFIERDTGTISQSTVNGHYVFSLSGEGLSGRAAVVGRFLADGGGNITNGLLDRIDAQTAPQAAANWTGSYAVSPEGRGTMSMNLAGTGIMHFAFYTVTNIQQLMEVPHLFMVSLDPIGSSTPLLSGQAMLGISGPWSTATWTSDGQLRVFALAGRGQGSGATALAGSFLSDGLGNLLDGVLDQNRAGVISSISAFTSTYNIDANGRGTATLKINSSQTLPVVFYSRDTSKAVVMGSPDSDVRTGIIWKGEGGAPNDNGMFSGDYICGPMTMTSQELTQFTGVLTADGIGHFSGTQDISAASAVSEGEAFGGVYSFGVRYRAIVTFSDGGAALLYRLPGESLLAFSIEPGDVNPSVLMIRR